MIHVFILSALVCSTVPAWGATTAGAQSRGSAHPGTGAVVRGAHTGSYSGRAHTITPHRRYATYSFGSGHAYGVSRRYYGASRAYGFGHRDYGYRGRGDSGYWYRSYHGDSPGLLWGLLSIPGRFVDALVGHPGYYPPPHRWQPSNATETLASGPNQTLGPMGATGPGWVLLAEGHFMQAQDIFARDARLRPSDGVAKVGLALSAAAGGDLERGTWAMRRAARVDPQALVYVVLEQPLQVRVHRLVKQYQNRGKRPAADSSNAFMLASLAYLLGDDAAARRAIDDALRTGDDSPSTQNLELLIEERQPRG